MSNLARRAALKDISRTPPVTNAFLVSLVVLIALLQHHALLALKVTTNLELAARNALKTA